jgi:hypothetical protein
MAEAPMLRTVAAGMIAADAGATRRGAQPDLHS